MAIQLLLNVNDNCEITANFTYWLVSDNIKMANNDVILEMF